MTAVAVDANAIHAFQEERINDVEGLGCRAVRAIFERGHIALDDGDLCLQEWIDCAGGKFPFALSDWVSDQIVMGKIKQYPLCENNVRKALQTVGLPPKDHKWVRLAIGSEGRFIVSNDIDFFEPKLKNASQAKKAKVRRAQSGTCAKLLRKAFGVTVVCLEHVEQNL